MKVSNFTSFFLFFLLATNVFGQLCPPFNLGPDTTFCGNAITIEGPPGYFHYNWSNGATTQNIVVSQTGTYTCSVADTMPNELLNAGFELGNTGFQSDYVLGTGGTYGLLSNEGTFAVTTNTSLVHNNFTSCTHVTNGNGNFLVVNGSATANTRIWYQTVPVTPNTNYIFSTWITSVVSDNPGILSVKANNVNLGPNIQLTSTVCGWTLFTYNWNSGANTSVELSISNQTTQTGGNDFAIDDISFRPICVYTDAIVVNQGNTPNLVASISDNEICENQNITLSASSDSANVDIFWFPGNLVGGNHTVSPTTNSYYVALAIDSIGCFSVDTFSVLVFPNPTLSIIATDSICEGETTLLFAQSNDPTAVIGWPTQGTVGNSITISPTTTTTTYQAQAVSIKGCLSPLVSHTLTVMPKPILSAPSSFSTCYGDSIFINATTDVPGSAVYWSNNIVNNQYYLPQYSQTVSVQAISPFGCNAFSSSANITVNPRPTVYAFADTSNNTTCAGEAVNLYAETTIPNSIIYWEPGTIFGSQISVNPNQSATFYAFATSPEGCASEGASVEVNIDEFCDCFVTYPNIFTPNGDNWNDFFIPINYTGCEFENYQVTIFNRWGKVVFASSNPDQFWDGKNNGNECEAGTYYYSLKYTFLSGNGNQKEGDTHGFVMISK